MAMANGTVKSLIRTLILDNEATLISGLTKFGNARSIRRVVTTLLTPADGYYHISINIPSARDYGKRSAARNVRRARRVVEYDCQIIILDEALTQSLDTNAYDQMASDFDLFVDRIENLIETQDWIGTDPKFELLKNADANDRLIRRFDLSGTSIDTERTEWATLLARLDFTLAGC